MTFHKIAVFFSAFALVLASCNPKAGQKMGTVPSGKAPKINIPTGDVRKAAPKAGDSPSIQIGKAETFQLDNGLKVILVENRKLPQVSFRMFVDYQPVLEGESAGFVDLMGDLITKGTATRTKTQIDEEVDFIGASLSGDANGVSASGLSKHTEKILALMSDVLLNPTFSQEEFEKSTRRTASGLASQKSDANAIAGNVGARLRYGKQHPYGEFITEESLKKVKLDQVVQHYKSHFKPNISYLVITGDLTRAKAEQFAKQYFGAWKRGDVAKNNYALPKAPEKAAVDFVHKPGAVQSVINITYPVELMPGTEEAIRARLMNTLFGGYFNSRINANLREGHGWTYGARSTLRPDELIGSFTANASVRNAVTDSSIIEFVKEMERMRTEKVPNAELQVVKNVLTGQFSRNLEEPGTVADFALTSARFNLPADYYETYLAKLNSTTPEQIMQTAQKFITPSRSHILVVGNKDDVADRLAQFGASGKVNFWNTEGEAVKNAMAVPPGVDGKTVVADYITAIGGAEKLKAVKDLQIAVGMEMQGMKISVSETRKTGNKLIMDMKMNGNSMGKTILNGDKASQMGMGGNRPVEGDELAELQEQSIPFKELGYATAAYQLTLKGIEEVNGKNAYVVEVKSAKGNARTEYYDVKTSLKIREISTQKGADGSETQVTNDMEDYKPVAGILFPHTTTTAGIFPTAMKAMVTEIKVNAGVEDAVFEVKK